MMKLSIVVPYHNRSHMLERMLRSVPCDKKFCVELILVNNLSSDNSPIIAQKFAQEHESDHFLQVICTDCQQPGAASARNRGANMANGKWIYFFDSDDEFSPDFLTLLSTAVEANPEADIIGMNVRQYFEDGTTRPRRIYKTLHPADQIITSQYVTQTFVFRREFYNAVGGWNELLPIWNDWEFCLRVLLHHPLVAWLDGSPLHRIYIHPNSITGADFSHSADALVQATETVYQLLNTQLSTAADAHELKQSLTALAARCAIVGGHLRREGSPLQASLMLRLTRKYDAEAEKLERIEIANGKSTRLQAIIHPFKGHILFIKHAAHRFIFGLLHSLTSHGVRGMWLIARTLLR